MNASALAVGQKIELNDGRVATVRFVGSTHFQTGDWVGVELEEPTGKNDGSVKGERYFAVEENYGMFLRPTGVRRVVEDVKKTRPANGTTAKARPSSVHQGVNGLRRQAAADAPGRRASTLAGSPTPGPRLASGIQSPSKSPTKQLLGNGATSSASTTRTNTPTGRTRPGVGAAAKPRPSLAPPSTTPASRRTSTLPGAATSRAPRQSLVPPSTASRTASGRAPATAARQPASRVAPARPSQESRSSAATEATSADDDSERPAALSPTTESADREHVEEDGADGTEEEPQKPSFAPPPIPPHPPPQTRTRRPSSPTAASVHSQRTLRSTAASNRQIEELEAKVRLLERKRMEDRDVKKHLEQAQQERDQYKGVIEKLQNKYRPQQQELAEAKKALAEAEKRFASVEALQAEHDSVMELATLDREMAEEKAEGLQAELELLRARNEEMELELEILREDNSELGKEMSPEERSSAGWAQMERSNERLRDALLRLRDITQDKEAELKERIDSLEDQLKQVDHLQQQYQETREKLLQSEANTEDLRQQLEVAQESEEMIEQLTDQNGRLEAQISQLRTTIEELEDLRDINDELQVNYTEQEKQLQDELDFQASLLNDRERTAKQQQEALDEADYTITRYRALVGQMQSDLADLQASKQISEIESKDLNEKSRAMLDLNMKLQASAAKTQVKTLDLELRKLEAAEASEHLAIVQLFLPDSFNAERDSVLALLRFKRIAFKASLIQSFIRERIASYGTRGSEENVFAACDVVDKLSWIAAMAERFEKAICSCSIESFARWEGALYELEPVERALNGYLEGFRRDEVREEEWGEELGRSRGVMEHLGGLYVQEDLASLGDELLMRATCLAGRLEGVASALSVMRGLVEEHAVPEEVDEDDEEGAGSDLALILNRAEALILSARNAKVMAGKTHRALSDLQARSLTLETSHIEPFDSVDAAALRISHYIRNAGEALRTLFFAEEGRSEPFTAAEVIAALNRAAERSFSLSAPEAGPFSALASQIRDLQDQLVDLAALPTDLDNTIEFERAPAPWVARSEELKRSKIRSVDTEAELSRALDALRSKEAVIKGKETELEEQSVRIEMFEARLKEAGKRSARIAELEGLLHKEKEAGKLYHKHLQQTRKEYEKEIERLKGEIGRVAEEKRGNGDGGAGEVSSLAMGAAAQMRVKRLEYKIDTLEGAVRFLKDENLRLKMPAPDSPASVRATMNWLEQPLLPIKDETRGLVDGVKKEGTDVLKRMLQLAAAPQIVDLTKLPEKKIGWRPKKEMPSWRIARAKEEWAGLRADGQRVVRAATAV